MAVIEILAVFGLLGFAGVGVNGLRLLWRSHARRSDAMREDLRKALESRDYRKLEDFVVIWGGEVDDKTLEHVRMRRNELFIEEDDQKPR